MQRVFTLAVQAIFLASAISITKDSASILKASLEAIPNAPKFAEKKAGCNCPYLPSEQYEYGKYQYTGSPGELPPQPVLSKECDCRTTPSQDNVEEVSELPSEAPQYEVPDFRAEKEVEKSGSGER